MIKFDQSRDKTGNVLFFCLLKRYESTILYFLKPNQRTHEARVCQVHICNVPAPAPRQIICHGALDRHGTPSKFMDCRNGQGKDPVVLGANVHPLRTMPARVLDCSQRRPTSSTPGAFDRSRHLGSDVAQCPGIG